jgi:hypothetical protein
VGLDEIDFLLLGFKLKDLSHLNYHRIHCPSVNHLLLFDLWVHEVSCEEEYQLRVETFLTDFFDK